MSSLEITSSRMQSQGLELVLVIRDNVNVWHITEPLIVNTASWDDVKIISNTSATIIEILVMKRPGPNQIINPG